MLECLNICRKEICVPTLKLLTTSTGTLFERRRILSIHPSISEQAFNMELFA